MSILYYYQSCKSKTEHIAFVGTSEAAYANEISPLFPAMVVGKETQPQGVEMQ